MADCMLSWGGLLSWGATIRWSIIKGLPHGVPKVVDCNHQAMGGGGVYYQGGSAGS